MELEQENKTPECVLVAEAVTSTEPMTNSEKWERGGEVNAFPVGKLPASSHQRFPAPLPHGAFQEGERAPYFC